MKSGAMPFPPKKGGKGKPMPFPPKGKKGAKKA